MTTPLDQAQDAPAPRTVVISGSSGLIGSALAAGLAARGHIVKRLVRRAPRNPGEVAWNPNQGTIDAQGLADTDAVINLAGETLDQRWTDDVKARIRESRVRGTALLSRTLAALSPRPRVFISGSAIGIYGDRGDEILDETAQIGTGFLASVCAEWEAATASASDAGVRVAHVRTGIVLARDGGALPRMTLPFRLGAGGRLGSGRQWVSWIALADVVDALGFLLDADSVRGAVNLVSPAPVRNSELTDALARELHRPAFFPVPRLALKLVLGEMADAAVLASLRVRPARLLDAGYVFTLPTLEQALAAIL